MGTIDIAGLSDGALLLLDSGPIIYFVEDHPTFGSYFAPLFRAGEEDRFRLAVSTLTLVEVLIGPLRAGDGKLARRYRDTLESWRTVPLDMDVAEVAARLRASLGFKLADAVQAASAMRIGAAALVTADRDFSRLRSLRVLS